MSEETQQLRRDLARLGSALRDLAVEVFWLALALSPFVLVLYLLVAAAR